jgi:hypothetical protein
MNVDDYIDSLPEDLRIAIRSVRELVNSRLPAGYEEGLQFGGISWFVPFTTLAETYNNEPLCLATLASQKSHMALYLTSVYGDPRLRKWFESAYKKSGKKLDIAKSCIRFKKLDALALDVIGEAIAKVPVDRYVEVYHKSRNDERSPKQPAKKKLTKKLAAKKSAKKPIKKRK